MEKFFWADQIAGQIIKRKKEKYVCASGITPSGAIHIGNFREIITTDLVVRALKDKGKKVRFIYSWDDYDRLRKIPSNVPKGFEEYIGMPVSEVPSPSGKGSYAEYFESEFEKSLEKVGIKPEFIRQNLMHKKCKYAKLIHTALENLNKIKKILNKYRKEPLGENWYPCEVYCEKCKRDSTKILEIKDYEIEYECKCGHRDTFDYRKKGLVKLKWRVDWPARWSHEKVDFEPGGIDHSVYGGSYMTSKDIVKIFGYKAPLYQVYEWIRIKGGTEFASSTGNATTLAEVEEIYEPEIIRYIFVSTRPNKGFQISFDADVIKIYDEYDMLEEKYYDKTATPQERRIYELSQIKLMKSRPEKTGFRHLITLVQIGKASVARAEKVKNWLEKYAPEDFKFEVVKKVSVKLDKKQKQALIALKESLSVKDFTEDELFNEFYNICEAVGLENKEFFEGAYMTLIGKGKGPRLAALILAIGKEKVVKLLEKVK
jgi:lysyl-tRNA synthetase class 1